MFVQRKRKHHPASSSSSLKRRQQRNDDHQQDDQNDQGDHQLNGKDKVGDDDDIVIGKKGYYLSFIHLYIGMQKTSSVVMTTIDMRKGVGYFLDHTKKAAIVNCCPEFIDDDKVTFDDITIPYYAVLLTKKYEYHVDMALFERFTTHWLKRSKESGQITCMLMTCRFQFWQESKKSLKESKILRRIQVYDLSAIAIANSIMFPFLVLLSQNAHHVYERSSSLTAVLMQTMGKEIYRQHLFVNLYQALIKSRGGILGLADREMSFSNDLTMVQEIRDLLEPITMVYWALPKDAPLEAPLEAKIDTDADEQEHEISDSHDSHDPPLETMEDRLSGMEIVSSRVARSFFNLINSLPKQKDSIYLSEAELKLDLYYQWWILAQKIGCKCLVELLSNPRCFKPILFDPLAPLSVKMRLLAKGIDMFFCQEEEEEEAEIAQQQSSTIKKFLVLLFHAMELWYQKKIFTKTIFIGLTQCSYYQQSQLLDSIVQATETQFRCKLSEDQEDDKESSSTSLEEETRACSSFWMELQTQAKTNLSFVAECSELQYALAASDEGVRARYHAELLDAFLVPKDRVKLGQRFSDLVQQPMECIASLDFDSNPTNYLSSFITQTVESHPRLTAFLKEKKVEQVVLVFQCVDYFDSTLEFYPKEYSPKESTVLKTIHILESLLPLYSFPTNTFGVPLKLLY